MLEGKMYPENKKGKKIKLFLKKLNIICNKLQDNN